eukprot:15342852-Ditylum_brightwellii.AAC.1
MQLQRWKHLIEDTFGDEEVLMSVVCFALWQVEVQLYCCHMVPIHSKCTIYGSCGNVTNCQNEHAELYQTVWMTTSMASYMGWCPASSPPKSCEIPIW